MSSVTKLFSAPKIKEAAIAPQPVMSFKDTLAARQAQRQDKKKRKGLDSTIKTDTTYAGTNLGGTSS